MLDQNSGGRSPLWTLHLSLSLPVFGQHLEVPDHEPFHIGGMEYFLPEVESIVVRPGG